MLEAVAMLPLYCNAGGFWLVESNVCDTTLASALARKNFASASSHAFLAFMASLVAAVFAAAALILCFLASFNAMFDFVSLLVLAFKFFCYYLDLIECWMQGIMHKPSKFQRIFNFYAVGAKPFKIDFVR